MRTSLILPRGSNDMLMKIFRKIYESLFSAEFLKFLLVGGTAALVNFFSRFLFQVFFPYIASIALAFILGSVISFIFNKIFTFRHDKQKTSVQLAKFTVMTIVSVFLASFIAFVVMAVYEWLFSALIPKGLAETAAHVIAIGLNTIYNFLAMKFFSFRKLELKPSMNGQKPV